MGKLILSSIFYFILVSFVVSNSYDAMAQTGKLVKIKVTDEIRMKLPDNLVPMTEQEIRTKYVSNKTPLAAYISFDKLADIGVNISNSRWKESDVEMLKNFYRVNILNLHSDVQFLNEGIRAVNNQDFVFFEFISIVEDEDGKKLKANLKPLKRYNYISYTIVNNKAIVFNFSSSVDQMQYYKPVLPEIMGSIKIKKTL
jgi:hypothetical protein